MKYFEPSAALTKLQLFQNMLRKIDISRENIHVKQRNCRVCKCRSLDLFFSYPFFPSESGVNLCNDPVSIFW